MVPRPKMPETLELLKSQRSKKLNLHKVMLFPDLFMETKFFARSPKSKQAIAGNNECWPDIVENSYRRFFCIEQLILLAWFWCYLCMTQKWSCNLQSHAKYSKLWKHLKVLFCFSIFVTELHTQKNCINILRRLILLL